MVTTYYLKLIANNIFKTSTTQDIPTQLQIGLSSTLPTVEGTNVTEPTKEDGYSRILVDNDFDTFDFDTSTGFPINRNRLYFPESLRPWNNIKYYIIYDTNENLLMFGELAKVLNIPIRTIVSIPEKTLKLEVTNGSVIK